MNNLSAKNLDRAVGYLRTDTVDSDFRVVPQKIGFVKDIPSLD